MMECNDDTGKLVNPVVYILRIVEKAISSIYNYYTNIYNYYL